MSTRYLLPCPNCEHQFQLPATQAGQELDCPQCSSKSEAPKLGQLKTFPTADGQPAKGKNAGARNNILTTLGLVLAILGGIAGGALYKYGAGMVRPFDLDAEIATIHERIDGLNASDVVRFYGMIDAETGLGEWQETTIIRYNRQGEILKKISYGFMGLGAIGLLMFLGSFFSKDQKR